MEREERKKEKRKGEDVENCADVSRKILEEDGRNRESGEEDEVARKWWTIVVEERGGAKAFLFLSASSNIAEPRPQFSVFVLDASTSS